MQTQSHVTARRGLALVICSGAISLNACQPGDDPTDKAEGSETGPVEQLECNIPAMFEEKCGGGICHSNGESTAAGLDLTSPGVEQRVSSAPGSGCVGVLADPADPEGSLLYTKVLDAPTCGSRMPLNGEPLTEDELSCMRDWISGLLPPDNNDCEGCVCEPGVTESCYTGPEGTADVGNCKSGMHTCQTSGLGWSECEGQVSPVGEMCGNAVDENCDGNSPACSEVWSIGFGDALTQVTRSVALDASGNVYAFGDFEGVVSYGGAPLTATETKADLVLSKHSPEGNPIWSLRAGDSSNQYASKLIVDASGNLILLARIYGNIDFGGGSLASKGAGDLLVVKLDKDGKHIWSKVFGDKDPERAERVVVDAQGDVLLTGTFTSKIDFGGGNKFTSLGMRDAFLVELDGATGEHLLSLQIGGPGDDYGYGIDLDDDGSILIGGRFQDTMETGLQLTSNGGKDIYLAKLTPAGTEEWSSSFGGVGDDELHDLRAQANGDIVLLGSMSDTVDFGGGELASAGMRDIFVATLDPNGVHIWSSVHGDSTDQFTSTFELNSSLTLALEPDGTIHIGGSLIGAVDFGGPILSSQGINADAWHVRLGADGSYLGGARYGGTATDLALDIAVSDSGHVIIGGRTHTLALDFGEAGKVPTYGGGDGYIAKLAPQ
jgi:hypothetical protein